MNAEDKMPETKRKPFQIPEHISWTECNAGFYNCCSSSVLKLFSDVCVCVCVFGFQAMEIPSTIALFVIKRSSRKKIVFIT